MNKGQNSLVIGHDFMKSLIEREYSILDKLISLGNPISNAILKRINLVLCILLWTYNIKCTDIDKDFQWSGILAAAVFVILSATNRLKV